ncbi:MAG: TlpA family protein disulfide reductase, partial [Prevotella sp.]|nr:TlpA family protein disulfide reductase [Prevotella sp.]
ENGNITIKGGQYSAKATGTPTNAEYDEYQTDINAMGNTIYSLRVNIGMEQDAQRQDSLKQVLKATEQLQRTKEMNFIRRYPNSPISQRIAGYLAPSMAAAEALDMLKMLSEEIQQSDEMQQVKKRAEQLAKVEAGAEAPNFTLPTENGSTLSLSDYKGKYVLIDFWASWCGPCRASFPAIAKLHDQYAGKLTIIGVSLDRGEAAWRKALDEEKCTWSQAWDQKGVAAKTYAVSAIPLLVLVGPDGKIIGRYGKADVTDELKRLFK